MSDFFISCKESKIENNRSFYGCFNLGPFEPSQSITIANALRRTLLSELYGLSIVSVEIEGVTHEYSNLIGVKDSVLDILLNLKEIIFKKSSNPLSLRNHWNFSKSGNEQGIKPQIGYLKVRGPGLVRASNLRLPPFIQCVDPDQYIATLAEDGFLNMKFTIQYGNKWASTGYFTKNSNNFGDLSNSAKSRNSSSGPQAGGQDTNNFVAKKEKDEFGGLNFQQINNWGASPYLNNSFNLHLKKRRLILKKLRHIGLKFSNNYINLLGLIKKKNMLGLSSSNTFQKNLMDPLIGSWVIKNQIKFNWGNKTPLTEINDNLGFSDLFQLSSIKKLSQKYPAINLRKRNKINSIIRRNENFFFSKENLIEKNSSSDLKIKFSKYPLEDKRLKQNVLGSEMGRLHSKHSPLQNIKSVKEILKTRLFNKITMVELPNKSNLINSENFVLNKQSQYKNNLIGGKAYLQRYRQPKKINPTVKLFTKNKTVNSSIFFNSTPLVIDAIFNPVTKVNYIIEVNDFKTTQNSFDISTETHELFDILNIWEALPSNVLKKSNWREGLSTKISPFENIVNSSASISSNKIDTEYLKTLNLSKIPIETQTFKTLNAVENILKIKNEINILKKETVKHNIILEIWTNGSIHPRDAIYQAFQNLIKVFTKLNKINTFMINPFVSNSLDLNQISGTESSSFKQQDNQKPPIAYLPKGGIGTITDFPDTMPLNETSFLATYMVPKLKKYYSTNFSNSSGLKGPRDGGQITLSKLSLNPTNKIKTKKIKKQEFSKLNLSLDTSNDNKKNFKTLDISVLNFSLRTYTCLKRLNINSIDELISFLKTNSINLEENSIDSKTIISSGLKGAQDGGQSSNIKLSKFSLQEIKNNLFD